MIGIHPSEQRDALEEDAAVLMHLMTSDEPISIETKRYKLVNAKLQLDFYQDPHPEVAAAAIVSPSGPRLAGSHGAGLISIGATMQAGIDVLAMHWDVAEARAKECGKTVDRKNWRLVGLMHLADTKEQAIKDVAYGLKEFCDYLQHTTPTPQLVPVGNSVEEYIEWAMSTGAAVIGTYDEAIEQIEKLKVLSNGGFGCYMLFDHNWAPWAAKKHHYEIFADFVIPHFKQTSRRLRQSELDTRAVRDELAAQQEAAIGAFAQKHKASSAG
jgi:limonene 1,2-monooxygenase